MARHRAPRYVRTKQVLAGVPVAAGATVVGIGALSTPAQAATTHDWTGVAQCESSGDWSINSGNGYHGGLQFSPSTWAGFGGTELAPRADLATPAQQVQIAERVLEGQGVGAWPGCGRFLTDGTTPAAAAAPAAAAPAVTPQAAAPAATTVTIPAESAGRHAAPAGQYTVVRGDTVARIAAAHGQSWQDLYQRNAGVIGADPGRITPGQVLLTAGSAPAELTVEAPVVAAAPAAAAPVAVASTAGAVVTNAAGPVQPAAQAAADRVAAGVPGVRDITIGGTRSSAVDPKGHPSGLALDYMVLTDQALGDAVARYHVENWDALGVQYVIWEQQILTSPNGSWRPMADRGGATANHRDHVHVNYRG